MKRAASAGTLLLLDLRRGVDVVELGQPARPDHGAVLNAGDNRDAVQNGARRRRGGPLLREVMWAVMRRSCEADYKPTIDKSTHSGVKQQISTFIRA